MVGKRLRIGVVVLTSVLVVAGWASSATAAEKPSFPADPPSSPPALVLVDEPEACPDEEFSIPELDLGLVAPIDPSEMEGVCSPPPQCFRDRDCDAICGKRLGVCRRVNSCYSECICSVA